MATAAPPLHTVPLSDRPTAPRRLAKTLAVLVWFHVSCFMINGLQFVVSPLRILFPRVYQRTIAYTKHAFGLLLVSMSQLFAPTRLVLSFTDAQGAPVDPAPFVRRDPGHGTDPGRVTRLNLPARSVAMANHQIYLDWLYLWCAAYYADLSSCIYIILKASLKWVPVIGWGMQFFNFIFLQRNWLADRTPLAEHLSVMAEGLRPQDDKKRDDPNGNTLNKLLLLIFPEGTLVSRDTRPVSTKFAAKLGVENPKNLILPRSTGLFFCLRTLAAEVEDLWLVDYTIGYPGVPAGGYGQDYYTLRSVFVLAISPPEVHINCTVTRLTAGSRGADEGATASGGDPPPLGQLPPSAAQSGEDAYEATPEEKAAFDTWLRARWERKDRMLDRFYRDGDFVGGAYKLGLPSDAVEVPVQLLHPRELLDVFVWFIPLIVCAAAAFTAHRCYFA